jgi:hypothetical protein
MRGTPSKKVAPAPEKPPPKPEEPQPESYEHFHARTHKHRGVLPHRDELPPSEANLPDAKDAPILPDAKECALPTPAEPVGAKPVPVLTAYKAHCKKKTGDEKGAVADRTEFEEVLKEWALFVGAVNLRLDEDLNRPDGKKFGVVGGRNANGPDHPVIQAVASLVQLAPALQAPIRAFIKKVNRSIAKKVPAVIKPGELSEEAAEWLAKQEGAALALKEAGTIGPYNLLKKFTAGSGGQLQAHHLVEQKWFKPGPRNLLKGDPDLAPSVILGKTEHAKITAMLEAQKRRVSTLEDLWSMYTDVYRDYPAWLNAIKSYFGK